MLPRDEEKLWISSGCWRVLTNRPNKNEKFKSSDNSYRVTFDVYNSFLTIYSKCVEQLATMLINIHWSDHFKLYLTKIFHISNIFEPSSHKRKNAPWNSFVFFFGTMNYENKNSTTFLRLFLHFTGQSTQTSSLSLRHTRLKWNRRIKKKEQLEMYNFIRFSSFHLILFTFFGALVASSTSHSLDSDPQDQTASSTHIPHVTISSTW